MSVAVGARRTAVVAPGPSGAAPANAPRARLVGLDLARTLAVLGMVVAHLTVTPVLEPWSTPGWLVAGRSSALFAVLAGVSVSLVAGRTRPARGARLRAHRMSLAVRALAIYVIGLLLDSLDSGIAVILPAYGAMFLLAVPFLGMGTRTLTRWAVGWLLLAPWAALLLRHLMQGPLSALHSLPDHGNWLTNTQRLLLDGYYPVIVWFGYVLAGMAVGRLPLARPRVQAGLLAGGTVLATAAWGASRVLTSRAPLRERLVDSWPADAPLSPREVDLLARPGLHGAAPPDPAWQLTAYPHASTMLDVLHTTGTSLAVLGAMLLLVHLVPRPAGLWAALGAIGTISLTAYSVHLVLRTVGGEIAHTGPVAIALHLTVLFLLALLVRLTDRRGPLESLISRISRSVVHRGTR